MIVYLAAPWVHREDARSIRDLFEQIPGIRVCARWLDVDEKQTTFTQEAQNDIVDIDAVDVLVVLNLSKSEGKAFEQGYAYRRGIPIVVVGPLGEPCKNVFQHLPSMIVLPDVEAACDWLADNFTRSVA